MHREIQPTDQLIDIEVREIRRQTKIKSFINILFIACLLYFCFITLPHKVKKFKETAATLPPIDELAKKNDIESCENICGVELEKCTESCNNKIFECSGTCDDEDIGCEIKCSIVTILSCSASCSNRLELCFNKCKHK
ncbi:hypothetical protein CONCODRAFT_80774 [Conidiobolus coronatus NRRL 28638]|uniref:Transmembrane protein n=1 Tax=Conidiobolus coronatus (strain ATCC 28846 / CBS 209.66 / NRRL 28638) TaxID=796925 RepID=A0A137NRP8_CONC2|nr:hypothetical protein CONCODRAFT_80774 [Conidiobolus coronatus NRRL 28638]|eukprot:KXN65415.1 hypothetical protein CONCODRAFT_80774 [Conidiobolus coronatus NRRL 28638]